MSAGSTENTIALEHRKVDGYTEVRARINFSISNLNDIQCAYFQRRALYVLSCLERDVSELSEAQIENELDKLIPLCKPKPSHELKGI